jgi:hypothetical protein
VDHLSHPAGGLTQPTADHAAHAVHGLDGKLVGVGGEDAQVVRQPHDGAPARRIRFIAKGGVAALEKIAAAQPRPNVP